MSGRTRLGHRLGQRLATLLAVGGLLAVVVPVTAGTASAAGVSRPADGVFVFDGRGFGHGRGMSQYGAYGAAMNSASYEFILAHYYVGSSLGTAPVSDRRVLLTGEDADLRVSNVRGLRVRDTASGATVVAGDRGDWTHVRARLEGGLSAVEALQGGAWVPIMPLVAGPVRMEGLPVIEVHHPAGLRQYRGTVEAARSDQAGRPLYVVNTVGLDDYVRGVVPAEMPASWHPEALKAQAVAARSYGVQPCPQPTAHPATGLYDVVDTTACQVYTGVVAETSTTNRAVNETAGRVVLFGGRVLRTEFSASNGGWTVDNGGAFVAKPDPYDEAGTSVARNPQIHRWTGVRVPASRLEAAFGVGTLLQVEVVARDGRGEWGGRALRVRLVGSDRTVEVSGEAVRSAAGLRSSWFEVSGGNPIDAKHVALGAGGGFLGEPTGPEQPALGGRFRTYAGGAIYWSPASGAREVHGAVRDHWAAQRWERGPLGYPLTDEGVTHAGVGRFQIFQGGSIYWTPRTGARSIGGSIRDTWGRLGWERSALGYPVTDETGTPDGVGRFNHFEIDGSIYWTPRTGAQEVRGSIRRLWSSTGWESGPLGYPTTSEGGTHAGVGRFNHFQRGSIYWTPQLGAHEVRGEIRDRWASLGWERSSLGYPTSDEYSVPGGRRSDFQGGSIRWDATTGATTVL